MTDEEFFPVPEHELRDASMAAMLEPIRQELDELMKDVTPAAILTAAADRIRDLAAEATGGPWQACEPWRAGDDYPVYVQTVTTAGYPNTDVAGMAVMTEDDGMHGGLALGDARWIAALSPAVAAPIEAILREAAESAVRHVPIWQNSSVDGRSAPKRTAAEVSDLVEHHYGAALALARAVLGEKEETDGQ